MLLTIQIILQDREEKARWVHKSGGILCMFSKHLTQGRQHIICCPLVGQVKAPEEPLRGALRRLTRVTGPNMLSW